VERNLRSRLSECATENQPKYSSRDSLSKQPSGRFYGKECSTSFRASLRPIPSLASHSWPLVCLNRRQGQWPRQDARKPQNRLESPGNTSCISTSLSESAWHASTVLSLTSTVKEVVNCLVKRIAGTGSRSAVRTSHTPDFNEIFVGSYRKTNNGAVVTRTGKHGTSTLSMY
jgi:hypothetical protein